MGVYAGIITTIIGTGVKLLASSQGPDYPETPKMRKIDIGRTRDQMENYEQRRMQAGIDAWKAKFPLLYQGGQSEIEDIGNNQQGKWSPVVSGALKSTGLETLKSGDQYSDAVDIGLSPITLAQRNSQAVNRQIALNPEWSSKISGGTLATMVANNYQNQNAFSQFLGAQNTARYVSGQQQSAYNTAALTSGILGGAGAAAQSYLNMQQRASNPLDNPLSPSSYRSDVSNPGYPINPTQYPQAAGPPTGMVNTTYNNNNPYYQWLSQPAPVGQPNPTTNYGF